MLTKPLPQMLVQSMFDDHGQSFINSSTSCCVNVSDAASSQTSDDTRVQILELDSTWRLLSSLPVQSPVRDSHAAGNERKSAAFHDAIHKSTEQ